MKKILLSVTILVALCTCLFALASCGGNGDECDHVWATAASVDTAPTCTAEGSESVKCLECGEKRADSIASIPAVGHSYTTTATTAATCTTDGSETKTCDTCGDVNVTPIAATGHTWATEATTDTAATCTTDGVKSIKCTVCAEIKPDSTETIPAGHTWADTPTTLTPATCTTDGTKAIKCIGCTEIKPDTTEVIPAAHTWADTPTVDTPATCTTAGEESYKCSACGAKNEDSVTAIPAAGHTGLAVVTAGTLFSNSVMAGTCTTCNEVVTVEVPAKVNLNPITNTSREEDIYIYDCERIGDVIGDKSLCGENSVDLYVEYSILLNSTMDLLNSSNYTLPGIYKKADLKGNNCGDGFYFLYITGDDYMPKGSFEIWNSRCDKVDDGYIYGPRCNGEGDDVYVGNFDGWHRIGVKMHFDAHYEEFELFYTNTVTLYIDGVRVHEYILRTDDDLSNQSVLSALSATTDDEKIVSCETLTDRYVSIYRFTPFLKGTAEGQTVYFPIADAYVSCDGFVMDVEPVANPEAKDFTQDGVTLSGKMYYQLKTAE